ncbi:type II toxin-antitoxin system prevent-host-death family antitoxin [Mesorhizobium sp. M8A.F.Ca.ET.059.01.1.1]|nr:type II toxin-antitoxin system prevent-host-death family antitoxin [Mesorhizobium sp. M8A.F.Ca.ET.059.01.1.1]
MRTMSAREAKNRFGLMIDIARAEPVRIEKHRRGIVVVISVEEYERLCQYDERKGQSTGGLGGGRNART